MNNLQPDPAYDDFEIVYDNRQVAPNADGTINIDNAHLKQLQADSLYHLGLSTDRHDLQALFGDVRFVCMGGTPQRMHNFARLVAKELGHDDGQPLVDIAAASHRYAMFKVGPVLSVSHGMGISSLSILMHEMIKLIYYARAKNVIFFRIGTCGGLDIDQGSVVITRQAVDELLRPFSELVTLLFSLDRITKASL